MHLDILDKFTAHMRNALSRSIDLAWELRQEVIPPLFLLVALSEQEESIAAEVLKKDGLTSELLHAHISVDQQISPDIVGDDGILFLWPEFSVAAKRIIEHAAVLALEFQHQYIGTEHLLLSITEKYDAELKHIFAEHNIVLDEIQKKLIVIMNGTTKFTDMQSMMEGQSSHTDTEHEEEHSDTPALDYFGVDLTMPEQQDRLDPVIGREQEIERLIHILTRRTKNNPVLIGEPGVGKTAIIEGVAKRIIQGKVPDILLHKRIISLDLSLLLAGTMYRGEFESRLKQIIDELTAHPECILFIDEMHTLVGAGGVNGGNLDAANILKPALAKGNLRCIGATTQNEYQQYIEKDAALERRFQPIYIAEPTEEEAIAIMNGLRSYYETYHNVGITNDAIEAAVHWSARYIPDKHLPDKAIDLIDEAGAKVHTNRRVPAIVKQLHKQNVLLSSIRQQKKAAVRDEKFERAVELKKKEEQCKEKRNAIQKKVEALHIAPTTLTKEDIAATLAVRTHIPLEHILSSGKTNYLRIAQQLEKNIVGQKDAIQKVSSVLKRSYAGISSPDKPIGSFLFLGPSGVGKTQIATVLAKALFDDANALIRMDMSEFSESFTVSKLVGAPAGYVGYNERIKLSDQIRQKPHSVVLFDEMEKAHPDIFNVLLQILDEGRLTDSNNRELNFRNSVIILTSNIGLDMLTKQAALGFDLGTGEHNTEMTFAELESTLLEELQGYFPLEFLNRLDHQIVFHPLERKQVEKIVVREFQIIKDRLQQRGVVLQLTASARHFIAEKSFSPDQGARLIQRTLVQLIEDPLADQLLDADIRAGDVVDIDVDHKKKGLLFKKELKKQKATRKIRPAPVTKKTALSIQSTTPPQTTVKKKVKARVKTRSKVAA